MPVVLSLGMTSAFFSQQAEDARIELSGRKLARSLGLVFSFKKKDRENPRLLTRGAEDDVSGFSAVPSPVICVPGTAKTRPSGSVLHTQFAPVCVLW